VLALYNALCPKPFTTLTAHHLSYCHYRKSNPNIEFINMPHSPLMRSKHSLYKKQMRKWINAYKNNWVRGAVIVQVVANLLSLE